MKDRVLSGYRPSGKLHLGHYHGNLKRMVELQETNECFFFVADWHALTTMYKDTSLLAEFSSEMVLDWIAAGLDPEKSTIYRQSDFPEIAELALYFGMVITLGELERCPTYKEQLRELDKRGVNTYGFLGYPVLQAADILIVDAELVPVGEDQLPHLELTREIARDFNHLYGPLFPEPKGLLSRAPRIPGPDARKMSKSYENTIELTDAPEVIRKKIRKYITDPQRQRRDDPGRPEVCSIFQLCKVYFEESIDDIAAECEGALIGCTDCKDRLADRISGDLAGFREKRLEIAGESGLAEKVLNEGAEKVRPVMDATLGRVRKAMNVRNLRGAR